MQPMRRLAWAAVVLGLAVGASGRARAQAIDFTGGNLAQAGASVVGWEFTTSDTLTVTALGLFSPGVNPNTGLAAIHEVGLWSEANLGDINGTLLISMSVSDFNVNTSLTAPSQSGLGVWLFADLASPLTLGPGNYVIGAQYAQSDPDNYVVMANTPQSGFLSWVNARTGNGPNFAFPEFVNTGDNAGIFGPNLLVSFGLTPVPEPSSLALAAPALLAGLAAWRWRRRRAA